MVPFAGEPIGLDVARTAKTLGRSFDTALADRGGSLATWLVLTSLVGGMHRSQRSIAAEVGVEGPTLTHHLNRMEAEGLVTRQRDPQNRRAHQVELTDKGHAAFASLLGAARAFDQRLRAGFTDAELLTLRQMLGRLAANAADGTQNRAGTRERTRDDHRRPIEPDAARASALLAAAASEHAAHSSAPQGPGPELHAPPQRPRAQDRRGEDHTGRARP